MKFYVIGRNALYNTEWINIITKHISYRESRNITYFNILRICADQGLGLLDIAAVTNACAMAGTSYH